MTKGNRKIFKKGKKRIGKLCMHDHYFDSGVFRTNSAPVTNKVDDRKMCVIHNDDKKVRQYCFVL